MFYSCVIVILLAIFVLFLHTTSWPGFQLVYKCVMLRSISKDKAELSVRAFGKCLLLSTSRKLGRALKICKAELKFRDTMMKI